MVAWYMDHPHARASIIEALRRHVPRGRGLEICAGAGHIAAALGVHDGTDPSAEMCAIAAGCGIHMKQAAAERLPHEDGMFDFVLIATGAPMISDLSPAFGEAARVLGAAGRLVLGFVDRDSPLGRAYEARRSESVFYRSVTFRRVQGVVSALSLSGFSNPVFTQTLFHDPARLTAPDTVLEGCGSGSFIAVSATRGYV